MVIVSELSPTRDAVMQRNSDRDYPGVEIEKGETIGLVMSLWGRVDVGLCGVPLSPTGPSCVTSR